MLYLNLEYMIHHLHYSRLGKMKGKPALQLGWNETKQSLFACKTSGRLSV